MNKNFNINGKDTPFEIIKKSSSEVHFFYDSQEYKFKIHHQNNNHLILKNDSGRLFHFNLFEESNKLSYSHQTFIKEEPGYSLEPTTKNTENCLITSLPGKVIAVEKQNGDSVTEGDLIAIIEAMKMEHRFYASKSGIMQKVSLSVGDTVPEGFLIGEIHECQ